MAWQMTIPICISTVLPYRPRKTCFRICAAKGPRLDELAPKFTKFQQHHRCDAQPMGGKGREYVITEYSSALYFRLLVENKPIIVDSYFCLKGCGASSRATPRRFDVNGHYSRK